MGQGCHTLRSINDPVYPLVAWKGGVLFHLLIFLLCFDTVMDFRIIFPIWAALKNSDQFKLECKETWQRETLKSF